MDAIGLSDTVGGKVVSTLDKAASSGARLAAAFAPFGPAAAGGAAAVGVVTSLIEVFSKKALEGSERLQKAAEAEQSRMTTYYEGLKSARTALNDARAEHALQWEKAAPEERAKMQRDASGRLDDYDFKLERGATFSDKEVLDAANWDLDLARDMLAAMRKRGDKSFTPVMDLLDTWLSADGAEHFWTDGGAHGNGFDPRLDALLEPTAPDAPAAPESPLSRLLSGPAAVDSLSSVGIGYTGSGDKSAEMLELLRQIADASARTARKDQIAMLK